MIEKVFTASGSADERISFQELLAFVIKKKWVVFVITLFCTAVAVTFAVVLPKSYEAEAVLSPAADVSGSAGGALSSLTSQFSGLASLAGLASAGDSKKAESIAVLTSNLLIKRYISENNLLPILFEKKWDQQNKHWKKLDSSKIPTLWAGSQYFKKKIVKVVADSRTGLVTVTVKWRDPRLAAEWANGLVAMTNDYLRSKAVAESERNIDYLTSQASKTNIVEARQAIFNVMQVELNKAMMARGSAEFAFKVIDPASAPENPALPVLIVYPALGVFGGLLLAVFVLLLQLAWLKSK